MNKENQLDPFGLKAIAETGNVVVITDYTGKLVVTSVVSLRVFPKLCQ